MLRNDLYYYPEVPGTLLFVVPAEATLERRRKGRTDTEKRRTLALCRVSRKIRRAYEHDGGSELP